MEYKNRRRELSDPIKRSNIHIIEVPEDEERKKGVGNLFEEIISENFLNLGKEYNESNIKVKDMKEKEEK